jgi:tryptophanyl-tRNA synthetase
MQQVSTPETSNFSTKPISDCSISYGDFKKQLADDIIAFCAPLRERILELSEKDSYIEEIINTGAEKARRSARNTIAEVRQIIGFRS